MKKLLLILTVLFIVACNPSRRINRIAEKYNLKQTETIYVQDTVTVPGDTFVFSIPTHRDTFFITEDGSEIETIYSDDSIIYLRITTPSDTVIKTVPVQVEKIVTKEVTKRRINWWLFVLALIMIAYSIYAGRKER